MMDDMQILLKNNKLIKAKFDLTMLENKIINKVFLDIQKNQQTLIAKISINDIKGMTNNKALHSVKEINAILKKLKSNDISQVNENGWIDTAIIAGYEYVKDENAFEIGLSPIFIKLVNSYKKDGFSSLSLTKYATLNGTSSQRIYELLRAESVKKYIKCEGGWKSITYKVIELRKFLCMETKYTKFNNFKIRVIETAIEDIQSKKMMEIKKVKYNRVGKEVESITFEVKDLEPAMYNFNENKKEKIDSDGNIPIAGQIEVEDFKVDVSSDSELLAAKSKLSVRTINKLIKDNDIKIVNEAVKILVAAENVKAPLKYLKGIIENLLKNKKVKGKSKKREPNFESRDIKADESLFGWDE
ncbi:replication initiation protein [uncultured Clostridium sp.]|uniref:replication initiation protein n=1 Tax=uncultured Clostridium sp. TaxID=59620 RepID=UPI00260E6255|nr:replication initiation protein [uncultured Clostridium sp.]